ncbi:hypothetical protein [Metapseudomonas otitidis]|uniref:hypothetical protein n=1 Tax=Metapseudomonas otitidis TaxID=319939 RepID=UPI0013F61F12|nr:hypothetical protein [Pseudomonas otitidis]
MSKSFDVKITVSARAVFSEEALAVLRGATHQIVSHAPQPGKEGVHKALTEAEGKGDEALALFFLRAGLREQVKGALVDLYEGDPVIRRLSPVSLEIKPRG